MLEEKTLSVSAIKDGTVIDHITAGEALTIIRHLKWEKYRLTVGINLKSASKAKKDIIKVEDVHLSESECAQIAIFAPFATVNIIRNFEVEKKFKVTMPEEVIGMLPCTNNRCITNFEKVATHFFVEDHTLKCKYCEKVRT